MTDEIGHAIAGNPQEQQTNKFTDFLTKPENLATALVLAAGLTSRRSPGQSKVNQLFTSGVGALGFRGALEKGVNENRATLRKEENAAANSAAELAQGARRNEIAADTNTVRREAINTPTPQTPSQVEGDQALAALRRAQAANVGAAPPVAPIPTGFAQLLQKNKELALANSLDGTIDLDTITRQTIQEQERLQLGELGAIVLQDGQLGINSDMVPADRRHEFPSFFDEQGNPFGTPVPTIPDAASNTSTPPPPIQNELLQITGGHGNRSVGTGNLVTKLRKARPEFAGQDDTTIANTLADVVAQVRGGGFDTASVEDVQAIIDQFGPGLPTKDMRKLRQLVRAKSLRSKFEKIKIKEF